jgi:hypothetical protein
MFSYFKARCLLFQVEGVSSTPCHSYAGINTLKPCFTVYVCSVQEEEKRHKEHVERVMARLRQEKDAWFLCRSVRYETQT